TEPPSPPCAVPAALTRSPLSAPPPSRGGGTGEVFLPPPQALHRQLLQWQRRVRLERVLCVVFGYTEGLREAEAVEIVVEACVVCRAKQLDRLVLGAAEVNGTEGPDILAEPELSPTLFGDLSIHATEILERWRVGSQDPRHDAFASGVTDRVLTDGEWLEQRGVRLLVGSRHHADLSNHSLLIDLARCAVLPRPLRSGPAPDSFIVGKRHLVILAVVLPGFFRPALLDDLDGFLVDLPVVLIDRGAIH